jgi:hypothetical protein
MPSGLPTEEGLSKKVKDFGVGTYDGQRDSQSDAEEDGGSRRSLPDNGGSMDPFGPDRLLSYPDTRNSSAIVPGDYNRHRRQRDGETIDNVVPSVANDSLPSDDNNPSSRSDYYDDMKIGSKSYDSIWPDEDSGSYASDSVPGHQQNNKMMDTSGPLGNYWSGFTIEDQNVSYGFPSEDFKENTDFQKTNDQGHGGQVVISMRKQNMNRVSTDLDMVGDLTSEFLKKCGKKDITRRCVTSFLQEKGLGYAKHLASDIIRCMKLRHKVTIADVLDQFPIAKQASSLDLRVISSKVLNASCQYDYGSDEAIVLRKCAFDIASVERELEKV